MPKRIIAIWTFCFLIIGCNQPEKIDKPDNLISETKMTAILYDLYTINAAKGVSRNVLENNGFVPETYILTKHNIDSTQFAESNNYYAFNTDKYKAIVESVKAKLEKEKDRYEELKKEESLKEKKKRDSIRNATSKKQEESIKIPKDTISKRLKQNN
jgi:hypothetical protein